jgi:hypothetical protein
MLSLKDVPGRGQHMGTNGWGLTNEEQSMKIKLMKSNLMKTVLVAACFLFATAAFAQSAPVQSSVPQPLEMAEHAQHASLHAMGAESSLLGGSSYSYAQGEQPLAQFGTLPQETPLGDIARAYRQEHTTTARATIVLEKQSAPEK